MWYEVLPVMLICGSTVVLPQFIQQVLNSYVMNGNPMRRNLDALWDQQMFTRDTRFKEKVWELAGLEAIPDE